jgi:uncharacterized protein YjbJ (UPF0337 family)
MNSDRLAGNWKQFKGKIKEKWGKLTDDDLEVIAGRAEQLVGRIQERYGIKRDQAQRDVDEYLASLDKEETPRSRGVGGA